MDSPIALSIGSNADCKDRPRANDIEAFSACSAWRGSLSVSTNPGQKRAEQQISLGLEQLIIRLPDISRGGLESLRHDL
jgi:hypothetical protein